MDELALMNDYELGEQLRKVRQQWNQVSADLYEQVRAIKSILQERREALDLMLQDPIISQSL
jgi:hypothetical protein